MNYTSRRAAMTAIQFRTGSRQSERFKNMQPINKQGRTTRLPQPKG